MFSLKLNGRLRSFERPLIMGILNVTVDSFFAGSRYMGVQACLDRAGEMMEEGADILDVGGQSTRPGSIRVSDAEESDRVLPVIEAIHTHFPAVVISVDTYHASVARHAVVAGAQIVNDISAGFMDPFMLSVVATLHVPYICMHMKGRPEDMQEAPVYSDVVAEVRTFLHDRIMQCRAAGIEEVIVDPGFGFGKTVDHNFEMLRGLERLKLQDAPLLVGLSRKSMIQKALDVSAEDALNGTTVLHTIALMRGADILRVHDVREAQQAVALVCRS
jgi:dihydropteroate synthase